MDMYDTFTYNVNVLFTRAQLHNYNYITIQLLSHNSPEGGSFGIS